DLLFLALVQGIKLAVRTEDEDAVHAAADEVVDEPSETGNIQILVVLHRGGDRWNDPVELHERFSDGGTLRGARKPRPRRYAAGWADVAVHLEGCGRSPRPGRVLQGGPQGGLRPWEAATGSLPGRRRSARHRSRRLVRTLLTWRWAPWARLESRVLIGI